MFSQVVTLVAQFSGPKSVVSGLFLASYSQLYFSLACYLRAHPAEALMSCRKAIDATLSAYYMMEKPGSGKDYLAGRSPFRSIKREIKSIRKKDPDKFPLAGALIELHEMCSMLAHADFEALAPHLKVTQANQSELVQFSLFHQWISDNETRFFLFILLHAYWRCALVFVAKAEALGQTAPDGFHQLGSSLKLSYDEHAARLKAEVKPGQGDGSSSPRPSN